MKKITNLKELAMRLLYENEGSICVGIIGDTDIADWLEPKLLKRLRKLLVNKYDDSLYK